MFSRPTGITIASMKIRHAGNSISARQGIVRLEAVLKALPEEFHFAEELHHHFAEGLYAREMRIPAGTLLVGKIHRFPCLNFIMTGEAEVRSSKGARRYKAPHIFESGAGTKRAMLAIKDLTWVTVHPTSERDLERLEDTLIDDHAAFLDEYGLTEEMARQVMDVPWIKLDEPYRLSESTIHGVGVFATMEAGDRLTVLSNNQKTEVGRFTNHSPFPNVKVFRNGGSAFIEAVTAIDGEIKMNYRHVLECFK